ncbi:MAG: hypothetical protein WDN69_07620 [Aliidongia sp.]
MPRPGSRRPIKLVIALGLLVICGALVALETWTSWRSRLAAEADIRGDAQTLTLSLVEHTGGKIESVDRPAAPIGRAAGA